MGRAINSATPAHLAGVPVGYVPPAQEKKFLPDAHRHFHARAEAFATTLAADPDRWGFTAERVDYIARLVMRFSDAHQKCYGKVTRTVVAIKERDARRVEAEREIRAAARMIRVDDSISEADKIALGIHERPTKLKKRRCPRTQPDMQYAGSRWSAKKGREVHVLKFRESQATHKAKPRGAVRVEIFYAWIEMGEKVPRQPDERARYLRSYTRTPIEVEFPVPPRPMLLVYWGRWADSRGEVGPFSKTVRARPEGWCEEILEARVVTEEPKPLEQPKPRRRLAA